MLYLLVKLFDKGLANSKPKLVHISEELKIFVIFFNDQKVSKRGIKEGLKLWANFLSMVFTYSYIQ